jgi:nitroreductase
VEPAVLGSLFEAARWAASAFNEQPWRFVVATRDDEAAHARLLSTLVPGNQAWAAAAPVLIVTAVATTYARTGKPNAHARHDLGLAVGQLSVEATSRGLVLHQMAGIDADRAREACGIPEGYEPVTAIALGYPGDPASLPDALRERETALRTRRPAAESVFGGRWGEPAPWA